MRPFRKTPAPTPSPMVINTKSLSPRAAPQWNSPWAARLVSLSTSTGHLSSRASIGPKGTLFQSCSGVNASTVPLSTFTIAGTPTVKLKSWFRDSPLFGSKWHSSFAICRQIWRGVLFDLPAPRTYLY